MVEREAIVEDDVEGAEVVVGRSGISKTFVQSIHLKYILLEIFCTFYSIPFLVGVAILLVKEHFTIIGIFQNGSLQANVKTGISFCLCQSKDISNS